MIRPGPLRVVQNDELRPHPAAEIFPIMVGADFDALIEDIRANGQREPIIVYTGMILDGRNRYRACRQLGIEAETLDWHPKGTPEAFVISMNLHRRHLNESQRALIAAQMATLRRGDVRTQRSDISSDSAGRQICRPSFTTEEAAQLLNVGVASVYHAKNVIQAGTPDEISAVERGDSAVSTIAKQIRRGQSAEKRKTNRDAPLGQRGNNPERIQRMKINAEIWGKLNDALVALTSLPMPSDVVEIIGANPQRRRIVDERLARSLQWLKDFEHACRRG